MEMKTEREMETAGAVEFPRLVHAVSENPVRTAEAQATDIQEQMNRLIRKINELRKFTDPYTNLIQEISIR